MKDRRHRLPLPS
uniref:Uncharacterized protein n=1 Tax=Anguilla anguilla TaxID=7936 RepID=A0A0E9VA19_ANGAN